VVQILQQNIKLATIKTKKCQNEKNHFVLRNICGDACLLSCISAEVCLTGWPNAWGRRDGGS